MNNNDVSGVGYHADTNEYQRRTMIYHARTQRGRAGGGGLLRPAPPRYYDNKAMEIVILRSPTQRPPHIILLPLLSFRSKIRLPDQLRFKPCLAARIPRRSRH